MLSVKLSSATYKWTNICSAQHFAHEAQWHGQSRFAHSARLLPPLGLAILAVCGHNYPCSMVQTLLATAAVPKRLADSRVQGENMRTVMVYKHTATSTVAFYKA
jgi:hypothetical protein